MYIFIYAEIFTYNKFVFIINKSCSHSVEIAPTSVSGQKVIAFNPWEESHCFPTGIDLKLSCFDRLSRHWNSQFQCT